MRFVACAATLLALSACDNATAPPAPWQPSVVYQWDSVELIAIRHAHLGPPMVARALAVAHTAMYDAWAAYDPIANGTRLAGDLRRPQSERTTQNKNRAVSFAAYRALTDLFPAETPTFDELMHGLAYDAADASTDASPAQGF